MYHGKYWVLYSRAPKYFEIKPNYFRGVLYEKNIS